MSHCVNIKHPEVKSLSEKIGLPLTITAAKISIWQENNTLENFPKPEELIQFINYAKQSNTVLVKDVNSIKTVLAIMEDITSKMAEDTTLSYFTINKFNIEGFKNVLSKRNIHKDLIDFIIDTVEKNNLYGSNVSEIVSAINKNVILTSAGIEEYYNRMSGEADNILNSELKAFLKDKIGVDVIEDLVETFGSAHAVADLLNKTVSVFGKSNLKTLPEETGHFFFELLGKSNPLYRKLFDNVTTWSGYEKVRKQYSKVYVKQNKKGEFVPDEDKIRREAVAQAIGEGVVRNYKSSQGDMFFTLIQEAIDFIRELVSKIGKFNFDVVVDDIAKDILKKNIGTLQQINDTNYKLRTYEETLLNEPTVKNIIDRLIKVGAVLTGSLSYRTQGTVYRPIDEDVHDIDTKIMWNSYKGDIEGFLNKLKEEFPDMTIRTRADGTPLTWEDWKTQSTAVLVHIEGFPIDLFFQHENYKGQPSINGNANWYDSFTAKLQMGRPKDMYDLLKWANFDRVNLNDLSQNTTFFQLQDVEQELKNSKFFSQHNGLLFIKKNFYPDAIKEIAKYNKKIPGLITVKRANNFGAGGREIFHVKINEDLLAESVPSQEVLFSSNESTEVNEELNGILINFLSQFGITAEAMDRVLKKGDYSIYALADFTKKIIRWAKGYESEIPEEAAHMIFELLDSGIKDSILNLVLKSQALLDYKKNNPGLYATDREYAKELAGQMLADQIKLAHSGVKPLIPTSLDNWFTKFINFLKKLFGKGDISSLENEIKLKLGKVAEQVFKGDTSNLSESNLEAGELYSSEADIVETQINSLKQRIDLMEKTINASDNPKIRSLKITKLKQELVRLQTSKNLVSVFNIAWREYKNISSLISKEDLTSSQLMEIQRTIGRLEALVNMTEPDELSDKLRVNFKELKDRLTQIKHVYSKRKNLSIEQLSDEQGLNYTKEQIFAPVEDVSTLKKEFMSLDSTNIPLLNLASSIFEEVRRNRREDFLEYKKKSNAIRAKYKKEDFLKYFDKHGRLILKTQGEYFEEERRMLERFSLLISSATTKAEKAKLYSEKANWYRTRNNYELTTEGIALFEEHHKEIIESYKDEDGNISAEDEKEIERWYAENNPHTGLIYAKKGIYTKGNYGWYRYLSATPKDVNPDYEKIKDDEAYKFIIDTLHEALRKLPHPMTLDVGNFDKAINEIIFNTNSSNNFTGEIWDSLKDFTKETFKIELTEDDIKGLEFGVLDDKGEIKPIIKAKNPSTIQRQEKFANPIDLMDKIMEVSIAYQYKTQAEDKIWLIESALNEQKALKVNRGGFVIKRGTTVATVEGGLRNAQEMLLYNAQAELYNQVRTDEDKVKPTGKDLKDFEERLAIWREEAKEAAKAKLPIPPKPTLSLVSAVKSTDALIDFTRLNLLGLKPFSATANLLIGIESNYAYAARNKDFNDSDLTWAFRKLMGNVVKYWTAGKLKTNDEVEKIASLAQKFGITNETLFEDANKYSSKLSAFLFSWQTGGEFIIANQILLAKLKHTKIMDLKGKERSLYDAFDKDGNWNTAEFGEQLEWMSESYMIEGKNKSKLRKFNNELKNARKRTQGDYMDAMKFKSKVWGRLFMIFRTWLPRAVNERFGEQVGEDFKGRYRTYGNLINNSSETSGYLKGVGKELLMFLGMVTSKSANLPGIGHLGFKSLSELLSDKYEKHLKELGMSDLDIENMRVNIREGQFILYLFILGAMLKGLAGDDDDELTYFANLANRLFQDVTFFYSFNSAFAIIKDPLPVYKTIQDVYEVSNAGFNYLQDPESDIYQRGFREGKSKLGKEVNDLLPVMSAYQSTMSTMQQVYGKDTYKFK